MTLPKDILTYSEKIQGFEVDKQILNATKEYVTYQKVSVADPIVQFGMDNPIQVVSGDTIEFTWTWHDPKDDGSYVSPGKVIFHATGSGSVYTTKLGK